MVNVESLACASGWCDLPRKCAMCNFKLALRAGVSMTAAQMREIKT
jgi:hypothetical protein